MYYIREKEGKNKNLKKEGKIRLSILISIYTVQFAILKMYTKFAKEGKMRISILISLYTVHFAILKVYTKFENTGSNRS